MEIVYVAELFGRYERRFFLVFVYLFVNFTLFLRLENK